jgi:Ca2+-binding RTX toxin-like protein
MSAAQVLEDRALLAANLTDGVLTIEGTEDADVVVVRIETIEADEDEVEPEDPTLDAETDVGDEDGDQVVVVRLNDETTEFPIEDVQSIVVTTGDGDDRVRINKSVEFDAEVDTGLGDDRVKTGSGDDVVVTGEGNDRIFTGAGTDNVDAGDGDDFIIGGSGSDTLTGGLGSDRIRAGSGDDVVEGGDGDDSLSGNGDNDTLLGGSGDDRLNAGSGNNELGGGAGNDTLFGSSDNDLLDGGEGENEIIDRTELINEAVDFVFQTFDQNEDGLLNGDDVSGFQGMILNRLINRFDTNDDGSIDREELTTSITDRVSEQLERLENREDYGRRRSRGRSGRFRSR